jgi:hypothetical protein
MVSESQEEARNHKKYKVELWRKNSFPFSSIVKKVLNIFIANTLWKIILLTYVYQTSLWLAK